MPNDRKEVQPVPSVALLVDTSKEYGRDLLRGIRDYTAMHGPWNVTFEDRGYDDPEPDWLDGWQGSGIITRTAEVTRCQAAAERGISVVDLRYYENRDTPPFPRVDVQQDAVAQAVYYHLRSKGFRHFGFVGMEGVRWSERRRIEFEKVVGEGGYPFHQVILPEGPGEDVLTEWIRTRPHPMGILAANDAVGSRVIACCQMLGLSIPGDVGVVGVDNDELLCELTSPSMSSVDQGARKVGFRSAEILDRLMRGEAWEQPVELLSPVGVVVRESTSRGAISDKMLARACQFIESKGWTGMDVADVVAYVGCSRRTLERRCKERLNQTVLSLLQERRLRHIKELLLSTDYSLDAIAEATGFSGGGSLSKFFRLHEGRTPGAYRQGPS